MKSIARHLSLVLFPLLFGLAGLIGMSPAAGQIIIQADPPDSINHLYNPGPPVGNAFDLGYFAVPSSVELDGSVIQFKIGAPAGYRFSINPLPVSGTSRLYLVAAFPGDASSLGAVTSGAVSYGGAIGTAPSLGFENNSYANGSELRLEFGIEVTNVAFQFSDLTFTVGFSGTGSGSLSPTGGEMGTIAFVNSDPGQIFTFVAVPEPAAWALLLLGMGALLFRQRLKSSKQETQGRFFASIPWRWHAFAETSVRLPLSAVLLISASACPLSFTNAQVVAAERIFWSDDPMQLYAGAWVVWTGSESSQIDEIFSPASVSVSHQGRPNPDEPFVSAYGSVSRDFSYGNGFFLETANISWGHTGDSWVGSSGGAVQGGWDVYLSATFELTYEVTIQGTGMASGTFALHDGGQYILFFDLSGGDRHFSASMMLSPGNYQLLQSVNAGGFDSTASVGYTMTATFTPVPEPSMGGVLAAGAVLLLIRCRGKRIWM